MALRFSRLDRPAIRRLKVGEKITEHGITVERLADGDLRYSVNVMVDGKRIHRVVGKESDGVTRTQCEDFISTAQADARAGRLSLPKGRKLPLTVARAADDYVSRLEQTGGRNIKVKCQHLRMHVKPFFGAMRLDAITTFPIERYKKQRKGESAAAATINRELATLSHLLSKALEWGWIDRIPVRPRQLPEGDGRITTLTDDEYDRLMQTAIAGSDPDLWLFTAIAASTSMRHSEILRARWDHLDLANRRLFIPRAKAGAREQPITASLADTLAREREMRDDKEGWIFPSRYSNSTLGHRESMEHSFRIAVVRAGLDPTIVTPHVLRHTAITKLVQAGVDLPTIQRISGHRTIKMVLRYSHVHGQHIDQAISALDRAAPEPQVNETGRAITQELHTSVHEAPRRTRK
jgi:integrase